MPDVFRSTDSVFFNSECLFVEYYDVIKAPWFILLGICRENENLKQIINIDPIENLPINSLFEWYVNRKYRNIFYELSRIKEIPMNVFDNLLYDQMGSTGMFFEMDTELNAVPTIKKVLSGILVKEIVIYTEKYSKFVDTDIQQLFGDDKRVHYKHGDINTVLNGIPTDTTYMLSDIDKVINIQETDHLGMSSIVIPHEYRYNKTVDGKWNVDLEYLAKENIFKVAFFNACYQ